MLQAPLAVLGFLLAHNKRELGLQLDRGVGGRSASWSVAGWALLHSLSRSVALDGLDSQLETAEGRTPEAECQWWADRLGSRQAEWGSAGAPRLFYSPEAESSGERFRPGGAARLQRSFRRRRIPAPLPKEDCRLLAYRHVPPGGKGSTNPAGSGAHGAADRPYPPSSPAHGAASLGGHGGIWRMEE